MENSNSNYEEALKRVQRIKKWYTNLLMFFIVNTCYLLFYFGVFDNGYVSHWIPWWSPVLMITIWSVSLIVQYLYIHNSSFIVSYFKNWETRKINEYLEQQDPNPSKNGRWE